MSRRSRLLLTAVLLAGMVTACANMGSPPGGPEDREPLVILGSEPAAEAAGVARDAAVTIRFAERPHRRSVMRALTVMPPADFRETAWTDTSLTLVPEPGWAPDRNTIVRVDPAAQDPRGNRLQRPFVLRFTTKAVADSGEVTGRVWPGREIGSSHAVLAAAYPAPPNSGADPAEAWPAAVDEDLRDGEFRLTGLDTELAWKIVGIANRDEDVRPGSSGELWASAPALVAFDESTAVRVPDFLVGTLDSLGTITGEVVADSADVAFVVAAHEELRERAALPGGGTFELTVPTGLDYRVAAFVDLDGDSLRGNEEPAVELEEPVSLKLTARREGLRFDLAGLRADSAAAPDTAVADSLGAEEQEGGEE